MYIRKCCDKCKNVEFYDVEIQAFEQVDFKKRDDAVKYIIENIEVAAAVSEKEFVDTILKEMPDQIHGGVRIAALKEMLQSRYGVAGKYCCDLIRCIKTELRMYSPDGEYLYFIKS